MFCQSVCFCKSSVAPVLTAASQDCWKMAPSLQPSPPDHRKALRSARRTLLRSPSPPSSDASERTPEPRWWARRRSWPTLPSERESWRRQHTTHKMYMKLCDGHTLCIDALNHEWNVFSWLNDILQQLPLYKEALWSTNGSSVVLTESVALHEQL